MLGSSHGFKQIVYFQRNEKLIRKLFALSVGAPRRKSVFESLHTELWFFAFFDISSLIENCTVALSVGVFHFARAQYFGIGRFLLLFHNHYITTPSVASFRASQSILTRWQSLSFWTKDAERKLLLAELYRFSIRVAINLLNADYADFVHI